MNRFEEKLRAHGRKLRRARLQTLQLNVGRKCNQACRHCHVDAGPWRTEMMSEDVAGWGAGWGAQFWAAGGGISRGGGGGGGRGLGFVGGGGGGGAWRDGSGKFLHIQE